MQPKHQSAVLTFMLMAALLVGCGAPAVEPTATPVPPTPDPMEIAKAYESAWNTFDAAAVTALFAEPFNTDYGFPMTDKTAWSEGWPYGMARGMGMRIAVHDCEVSGDTVTCKVASQSPCFTMDVIEALTVQDGKITRLEHRGIPEEDARWEAYSAAVEKWAEEQGIDEWPTYSAEVAKGTYGYDWGAAFVSLCQKFEAAGQSQAQDPAAVVQGWFDALNAGDLDGALALMIPNAEMTGVFTQPTRNVLKWWIDLNINYSAPECQLNGDQLTCDYTMTDDGCIAASGNTHGLPLRSTFTMQNGNIQRVLVEIVGNDDWNSYGKWLAEEEAWEKSYRAEERTNIDYAGYSKGGDVAIKLCQDYADFVEKQVPVITASAQALVDAINSGNVDAALALLADDAEFQVWTDEAAGAEQLRPLFDRLAGKETQYQITDCTWEAIDLLCAMSIVDGCTTAYGATDGLPGKVRFYALEDGTLRQIDGALTIGPRKEFQTWLEAEAAWASANRADELAQAEGYSKEAGEMAVQLCQEYAATQAEGTSTTSDAQPGSPAAEPIPIIWDDDGSIDGVTALLYLLRNPSFDVKATTISPGIAHPEVFAPNLARFLALLGVDDVPVAAGPEQPLAGDNAFPAEWRAASDKFWDLELPDAAAPVDERTAAELIVDVIKNSQEPVTIFVSGSLTNLAQALRDDSDIKDNIRSVEIMGGAVKSPGNVGSVPAEWNIYIDPVAAEEVFASGVPIHMTPLDATDQIPWMDSDATAWETADAPGSAVAARFLRRTMSDWSSPRILIWDLVAALNAAHPELCQWQDVHLTVAQPGAANEGQTVLVESEAPNAKVCLTPDVDAYHEAATEVFAAAP